METRGITTDSLKIVVGSRVRIVATSKQLSSIGISHLEHNNRIGIVTGFVDSLELGEQTGEHTGVIVRTHDGNKVWFQHWYYAWMLVPYLERERKWKQMDF